MLARTRRAIEDGLRLVLQAPAANSAEASDRLSRVARPLVCAYFLATTLEGLLLLHPVAAGLPAAAVLVLLLLRLSPVGRRALGMPAWLCFLAVAYADIALQVAMSPSIDPVGRIIFAGSIFALAAPGLAVAFLAPAMSLAGVVALGAQPSIIIWLLLALLITLTLRKGIAAEAAMRRIAEVAADTDVLTGLGNRSRFFRWLEAREAEYEKSRNPFVLAIIDLDGFKPINDLHGHATGDEILRQVGSRLAGLGPASGRVARIGGDEFAVIIDTSASAPAFPVIIHDLQSAIQGRYEVGGLTLEVGCTIGAAEAEPSDHSAHPLMVRADYALYHAKQSRRGDMQLFGPDLAEMLTRHALIEHALRNGDLEQELFVVFQPQVDAIEQRTIGFEALARWQSATLGMVRPDVFIRAAERCGIIEQVTGILFRKALKTMTSWPDGVSMSFNLSARDLMSPASVTNLCWLARESGIEPHRIVFEITETTVMTNVDIACEALKVLWAEGFRIALDDFGSGYSSFSYIHKLPLNKIKIDRSFVSRLNEGPVAQRIIKTIIELCDNLGLDCIIEGVETEEELEAVLVVNGRVIQGYYFGKPLLERDTHRHLERELDGSPVMVAGSL